MIGGAGATCLSGGDKDATMMSCRDASRAALVGVGLGADVDVERKRRIAGRVRRFCTCSRRESGATLGTQHVMSLAHSSSPLWLVTDEPAVNELVSYLDAMRRRIEASPDEIHVFEFSRTRLADVRTAFARMIRHGEEQLHRVCELLGETFLDAHLHAAERRHRRGGDHQGALHAGEEHLAWRPLFADRPRPRQRGSCGGSAITTAPRGVARASSPTSSSTSRPG